MWPCVELISEARAGSTVFFFVSPFGLIRSFRLRSPRHTFSENLASATIGARETDRRKRKILRTFSFDLIGCFSSVLEREIFPSLSALSMLSAVLAFFFGGVGALWEAHLCSGRGIVAVGFA